MPLVVGVLALQGDFTPHLKAIERVGHTGLLVRYPEQLDELDALILPGGESTTIWKLLERWGFVSPIRSRVKQDGLPVWGTCAGAILLATRILGRDQPSLGLMEMSVERNAYGRQVDSFEAEIHVEGFKDPFRAVFIRAPIIREVGSGVRVLAVHEGAIVAAQQGRLLATTFHPELTEDDRILRLFLESVSAPAPQ